MRFGGYYNDDLVLGFNDNNEIAFVNLRKEARLFGREIVKSCNLEQPFQYSIQPSEE